MAFIKHASKKHLIFAVILLLVIWLTVFALQNRQDIRQRAATPPAENVGPTETSTILNWPERNGGYQSLEWETTIRKDPTPAGYSWNHMFIFVDGLIGQAGLQSEGTRNQDGSTGKTAVFSIWNAIGSEGGGCGVQTIGLPGQSCSIAFEWNVNNVYNLKVAKVSSDASGTWWSAWVKDNNATSGEVLIGKIKVPPDWKDLANISMVYSENVSPAITACSQLIHSSVRFTNLRVNSVTQPASRDNYLSNPVKCPGSSITDVSGGVQHDMGNLANATPYPSITQRPLPTFIFQPSSFPIYPTIPQDLNVTPGIRPSIDPNQPATELQVAISFPGIGSGKNPSPRNLTREVMVGVYSTENKVVGVGRGFLKYDNKGAFRGKIRIGQIPNGTYYVKIISTYTLLTLAIPQFYDLKYDAPNEIPEVRLTIGDYNADQKIDISDYSIALTCYQSKKCPSKEAIDLNDDGKSDVTDYNLFLGNYKRYEGD